MPPCKTQRALVRHPLPASTTVCISAFSEPGRLVQGRPRNICAMVDVTERHWHSSNDIPAQTFRSDSLESANLSDASSSGDDSVVRQIAVDIARDTIERAMKIDSPSDPSSKYQLNMRSQVDVMLSKHHTLFQGMVKQLLNNGSVTGNYSPDKIELAILSVADEMFADSRRNWGRVVALYAFVAELSTHMKLNEQGRARLAQTIGTYVSERLGHWIERQGGWNAFMRHFPCEVDWEKTIFKGLLATGLGLGVLAGLYALR
uniref:Bcl-2 Bcl-2 homology region 1-3 domain-containing protein n=1 Tax=Plectus sambesii TaxID=2011161 RepID=A0A914WFX2_9BILA